MVACTLGCRGVEDKPRQAVEGWYGCQRCADRLAGVLDDIGAEAALLDDPEELLPRSGQQNGNGRRAVPGPRSPAADALIVQTDVRSTDDQLAALATIESWTRVIREDTSIDTEPARMRDTVPTGRATIARELATIRFHWHWVLGQEWLDDFASEMYLVRHALRTARGDFDRTVLLGRCPGESAGQPCGAKLRSRLDADNVHCGHCGSDWPRPHWARLALLIEDESEIVIGDVEIEARTLARIRQAETEARYAATRPADEHGFADPVQTLAACQAHRQLLQLLRYYRGHPAATVLDHHRYRDMLLLIARGYGIQGAT